MIEQLLLGRTVCPQLVDFSSSLWNNEGLEEHHFHVVTNADPAKESNVKLLTLCLRQESFNEKNTLERLALPDQDSEVASLMRTFDWGRCQLGAPEDWPAALFTLVNSILRSKVPGESIDHVQLNIRCKHPEAKHSTLVG